jgi:single-stranded-DNA-specific exonuclease
VDDSQPALIFCAPNWHRGVLGIVASRLVERFHRPVFVLSEDPEEGVAQGSGRSIACFHLLEALETMPDLFMKFGGHRHAAGLTLAAGNVGDFRRRFRDYAAARLSSNDFFPELAIDGIITLREINERTVAEIATLAPFGCGHPAPVFAARDVEVAGPPVLWKEKHLRVPLRQDGRLLWLKAWNFADRIAELAAGTHVDAALSLEEDSYAAANGLPGWSAVLRDVRPPGAPA